MNEANRILVENEELGAPLDVNLATMGDRDTTYKELQGQYVRNQFANYLSASSSRKWWTAIVFTVLFWILSSPRWYESSTAVTELFKLGPTYNCHGVTSIGLFIHGVIFLLLVRWLLN